MAYTREGLTQRRSQPGKDSHREGVNQGRTHTEKESTREELHNIQYDRIQIGKDSSAYVELIWELLFSYWQYWRCCWGLL
jgi:hypothetical protein